MQRIEYHKYGGPECMAIGEFDLSPPGPGEVAVRVEFAAINPIDWKLRNGQMKIVTGRRFPRGMGMDFSGTVLAFGQGVKSFRLGDRVFGLARFKESGALAEAVVTKEAFLACKPDNVSFDQAACLGTPGVTAWNGLIDKAKLKAEQRVFINGCAGAVGEAAVQIAQLFGAEVWGRCSARDMDRARALGVQRVYDYRTTSLSEISERFDVVYDTSASMSVSEGFQLLKRGGVFLDLNPNPAKLIRALVDRRLKPVIGTARPEILERLAAAAAKGRFKISMGQTVPLSGAIQLITELEAGRKLNGKGLVAME
ncbi:alcohol dehydrogenase [Burkholderia cepacia]|uniref:NAD(P)-dependent alcohol dehydrogenase n=1 Tax=Burkholderia cepacia TaxID=292 RepID=UPI0007585C96|nr:NAD(P)-dependent alcohol dehydrogenase [Burkholderia cepacia]KVA52625.1 alcohol dehydrogenase [Burkholderia cepacia]KVA54671.1 alcohol dehydrogenase [Burkholderia cepacia]KVA56338.1 alcohol dehydrogenase [Burkholderia cepacia]KVA87307.1 alcohol dehydrogenase [Burkholderia cepacia]KVA91192.1 alcohol dehydrogenase [Burkholderia cepacia]